MRSGLFFPVLPALPVVQHEERTINAYTFAIYLHCILYRVAVKPAAKGTFLKMNSSFWSLTPTDCHVKYFIIFCVL
jgi:hypothetical protein